MDIQQALSVISDPTVPCADRIRTAMTVGLEPYDHCEALRIAEWELDLRRLERLADETPFADEREKLIEQADALLSIPF
jgi:hypothetical protein